MSHSVETYHLHAYLDGELSHDECIEVERALEIDSGLRQEFEKFKSLKNNMRKAYSDIPMPPKNHHTKPAKKVWWNLPKTAAASLLLGLLIGAGVYKVVLFQDHSIPGIQQAMSENYLVHIDSDSPDKQIQAIKEIEALLETVGANAKVDLISNYKGVQLLDVNNPNNPELSRLLEKYDNLTLFACKRALERARQQGKPIKLMPKVEHEKPAIDAVVDRLNSGWNYIKI
ncbi:MAG: zf-HC2 domain-containing protein [Thiomicrorhabdus sp.]|nr:zf-HC2 domain-containing protein [Thiomicrorhabdus sp.]